MPTIENCVICRKCLMQANDAGQLLSARRYFAEFDGQACEQCGLPLVDGEISLANIEP